MVSLPHLLLGLLRTPASGYELKQQLDSIYSHAWNADLPQIYRTLNRMERDGWLTASAEPSDKGPERKVYTRTEAGLAAMSEWVGDAPPAEPPRSPELVRVLLLGENRELSMALNTLQAIRAGAEQALERLRATAREWASADVSYPDCSDANDFFLQLTLDARIQELQARLAWASRCIYRVEARIRGSGGLRQEAHAEARR